MLRDVLKTFLSTLTEREFDGPFLGILQSRGFTRIHFTHGVFEFGKDVIAQRLNPQTGELTQYAIQSKAGDLGQAEWRAVRPQLDEAAFNDLAHPAFDADLPRVVVLVTTGRLKGGAAVDAQQFKQHLSSYPRPTAFEIWDEENFVAWLSDEPALGLAGTPAHALDDAVVSIRSRTFTETALERFSRRWTSTASGGVTLASASIESAIIANLFREMHRLDHSALVALHLLRAAWSHAATPSTSPGTPRPGLGNAALRLFGAYVDQLLTQTEPQLSDPRNLVRAVFDEMVIVTYPAITCRMAELFGAAALFNDEDLGIAGLSARAKEAALSLARSHPGASRPISDGYAVSIVPPTIVALRHAAPEARAYLRSIAEWLLDRHNPAKSGLGLGSIAESEDVVVERLLGGYLESTVVDPRSSSLVATALLDLLILAKDATLYEAVRKNLIEALRVIPSLTSANEISASWHRGGPTVWQQVRVEFPVAIPDESPTRAFVTPRLPDADTVALALVARTRYDVEALRRLVHDDA